MLFLIIFVNWIFLCQKKIGISVVFLQQYHVPDLNTDYNQKLSWFFTTFQVVRLAFAVPVNHELTISEFNLNLLGCNNPFMRQANHSRSMRFDQVWSMPLLLVRQLCGSYALSNQDWPHLCPFKLMFNVSFYKRCTDPEQSNRVYRNYANSSFTRRINWLFFNKELTNSHSEESFVQNQWLGVQVNKFVMFRGQAYPKLNIDMFITPMSHRI